MQQSEWPIKKSIYIYIYKHRDWSFTGMHLFSVSRYLSCLQLLRPVRMLSLQESCWYKDECDNDVPFSLTSAAEEEILVKHDHVKRARGNRRFLLYVYATMERHLWNNRVQILSLNLFRERESKENNDAQWRDTETPGICRCVGCSGK